MPFLRIDVHEFKRLLDDWYPSRRRSITEVHMHHTWRPDVAGFEGRASIDEMWRRDTEENDWSDIAQHVTIDPDGMIWTGRHWDAPPASVSGRNGDDESGPFMVSVVGDFDDDNDKFDGAQREATLRVIALIQDRFELKAESLQFHNMLGTSKTCPGSGISYSEIVVAVRALRGTSPPRSRRQESRNRTALRDWLSAAPRVDAEQTVHEPNCCKLAPHGRAARGGEFDLDILRPHVINIWNGRFSTGGAYSSSAKQVARIFSHHIPAALHSLPASRTLPIVLYAHGGLVSEEAGLHIAQNQIPWWKACGVYPIHFAWETGLLETILRFFGVARVTGDFADISDALVESTVRAGGGEAIWGKMKEAASSAFERGAAGTIVLEQLTQLVAAHASRIKIYAIGHSAGSIFHAHLLQRMHALNAPSIEALYFLAPAITADAYLRLIDPLLGDTVKRVDLFTMSDRAERDDTVTFAYRKSLLYLIHNALEAERGEPILGLEQSMRSDGALVRRFGLGGTSATGSVVFSPTQAATGSSASRADTHGGFDNDPPTMESIARRILRIADSAQLPAPFPPDTESRSVAAPPRDQRAILQGEIAMTIDTMASGRRAALCIGINEYNNPDDRLSGCVADAQDWEAALTRLGFEVQALHDSRATKRRILDELAKMIANCQAGDVLVLQYSGHGTFVPDQDGDDEGGQDEAICPVDYDTGELLIDDEIRAELEKLPQGVQLTMFMDNCYSYSNGRFALGRAPEPSTGGKPRFVKLRRSVVDRFIEKRRGARRSRASSRGGTQEEMRWVSFSACKDSELAWETNGRGDYSRVAVPLLSQTGLTNRAFNDAVVAALGASPRQTPMLDCPVAMKQSQLLAGAKSGGAVTLKSNASGSSNASRADEVADLLEAIARVIR